LRVAKDMPVEKAAKVVDRAQDHLLEVAWAHVDRILLEALLEAEATLTSDTARDVMEQVRDVYFLDLIVRTSSWYLEQNLLAGPRAMAARAALNDVVDSLGTWSELLVDAFGVPSKITSVNLLQR